MNSIATEPDKYLATTVEMLVADGLHEAANLIKRAEFHIAETGYDNWNGGTTQWTFYFRTEPAEYVHIQPRISLLEEQIKARLEPIVEQSTNDWYEVKIAPKVTFNPDWRNDKDGLTRTTRQNIIDGLKIDNINWSGRLEEVEFLGRIFDLENIQSHDSRFPDAAGDIWQHRVNNPHDWEDDWIYTDKRFNLLDGPPDAFLKFLCEMVHPVVRPDRNEALMLVQHFNDQLRPEGWIISEEERIAGRSRFAFQRLNGFNGRSVSRAKSVADALDAGWMQREIERLEHSVEKDPALAIGTAKDLVESCCKTILNKRKIEYSKRADLPELTKLLTKELKLVPEGIPDKAKGAEAIRLILRNLTSLTQYLAEIRGLYGSGHGRDGQHRGLEARHARLAVASAVAFIDFVTDTHHRRPLEGE